MKRICLILCLLAVRAPAHAAESALAAATKAAPVNTLFLIAGEDATVNDPMNASGWNHTVMDHNTTGSALSGCLAEQYHIMYDMQRLRLLMYGTGHQGSAGGPLRACLMEYSISNNLLTNKGDIDPTGIFDTYNAAGTRIDVSIVSGSATGSGSQIGVAQDSATGGCSGATFNVKEDGAGSYSHVRLNLNSALAISGCSVGNHITILGNHLGGASPANDLVLNVDAVTANGINNNGHGYHLQAPATPLNKIFRIHTGGSDNVGVNIDKPFSALTSDDFEYDPLPETSGGTDRGALEYSPERSALWHFDTSDVTLKELNLAVGSTWQSLHTFDLAFAADGVALFHDELDKCELLIGGGQPKVYRICIGSDLARTLTITALDNAPHSPYFASGGGAQCLGWFDPINGHFFEGCPDPGTAYQTVLHIDELNLMAGSGSQWTSRDSDLVPDFNLHYLGQGAYFSSASAATVWDQGIATFGGRSNLWGWKGTANNRAGWETGDGTLSFADITGLPGVTSYNAFNDPTTIKPQWDAADTALTSEMATAGYLVNHTVTFAAGGGNATAIRQPYGGYVGGTPIYSIPKIVSDSGDSWLNLSLANHSGESTTEFIQPIFGDFATAGTQEPIIAPNSTLGRTLWIRLDFKPSPAYFSTLWRRVHYNYQTSRDVGITLGSDVIRVSDIALAGSGIYAGCSFTACGGTWATGRGMVIHDGSGLDNRDIGHYVLGAPVDATHIHVFQADGVTPASWFGTATGVGISISGAGILDGTHDSAVNSFKLGILNNTVYYKTNVGVAGTLVLLNDRPDGVYDRLTNSPNVYQYDSGIQTNGTVNDGTVPFVTPGINTLVARIETTDVPRTASGGLPYTNTKIDWWLNGVGGPTYSQTHWANGPGVWGDNDGAGHKFGFSYLELVAQHTDGDPLEDIGSDMDYLIKSLVISTEPIPLGAVVNVVCTPDHLSFISQPSNALLGASLGTVTVHVKDSGGSDCTSDTTTITLSKHAGTCTGMTLNGTVSGSNQFTTSNLDMTVATGSCSLDADDGMLTGATSNSFTISNPPAGVGMGKKR